MRQKPLQGNKHSCDSHVLTFSSWRALPSKSCPGGRWGYTVDQPEWPSESCSYANGSTCSQPEEESQYERVQGVVME